MLATTNRPAAGRRELGTLNGPAASDGGDSGPTSLSKDAGTGSPTTKDAGTCPTETVTMSGVSPTRLWLGTLPGEGDRESLQGFLGQDTYVRIYIPVAPR